MFSDFKISKVSSSNFKISKISAPASTNCQNVAFGN